MTDKPCSTCGLVSVGQNGVAITDMRKYLTSPIPCPECMEEARRHFAELGRKTAMQVDDAVWDALERP